MLRINQLAGFGSGLQVDGARRPSLVVDGDVILAPSLNDPDWSSVVFLSGYEGSNGSVVVTDESGSAHGTGSITGAGAVTTSQFKYGVSSFAFDGNTVIRWADHADWSFGAGNFTIDTFIRPTSNSFSFAMCQWPSASGQLSWALDFDTAWSLAISTTGSDVVGAVSGGTVTLNVWQQIRVDYDGSAYRIYKDGVMVAKGTTPYTIFSSTAQFAVGGNSDAAAFKMSGQLDETRITKGIARCGSDLGFFVPSAAYPRS